MGIKFVKFTSVLEVKGECQQVFYKIAKEKRVSTLATLMGEPGQLSEVMAKFIQLEAANSPVTANVSLNPSKDSIVLEVAIDVTRGFIPLFNADVANASKLESQVKQIMKKHYFETSLLDVREINGEEFFVLLLQKDSAETLLFAISEFLLNVRVMMDSGYVLSKREDNYIESYDQLGAENLYCENEQDFSMLLGDIGVDVEEEYSMAA